MLIIALNIAIIIYYIRFEIIVTPSNPCRLVRRY